MIQGLGFRVDEDLWFRSEGLGLGVWGKPLSDFLKHVSYGNSQYFCALAAFAPSRPLGEARGRSVQGSADNPQTCNSYIGFRGTMEYEVEKKMDNDMETRTL